MGASVVDHHRGCIFYYRCKKKEKNDQNKPPPRLVVRVANFNTLSTLTEVNINLLQHNNLHNTVFSYIAYKLYKTAKN